MQYMKVQTHRQIWIVKGLSLFFILFLFHQISHAQAKTAFTGMLEYKITVRDTSLRSFFPDNTMAIYTNDTVVRQENFTPQLGQQVNIRHIEKNKSYLLLQTDFGKFAIPSDLNALMDKDSSKHESKYTFTKKGGSRKFVGQKAKRMLVTHSDSEEIFEFWYFKKVDGKYNDAFNELPGLPVKYSIVTPDAIFDYELVRFAAYTPNRDMFGVPSDFERINFDEFIERMLAAKGNGEIIPD